MMMNRNTSAAYRRALPCLLASLFLSCSLPALAHEASAVGAPGGKKVWITLGEKAMHELQGVVPGAAPAASKWRQAVSGEFARQEQVHMLQVDEAHLSRLSAAVHEKLRQCGGYMAHASEAEARAALAGPSPTLAAVRPSYVIDQQSTVNAMLPGMQAANIGQTIVDMSTSFANRYYKTNVGVSASNWLLNKWKSMTAGRSDISVTQYTHANFPQKSVILTIQGTDNGSEVVVMGAHLDSILSGASMTETSKAPGADDDASGIASLTEALRVIVANGYKPRRTIKIMGYAAEEVGLLGSKDIANNFKTNNVKVAGVLNLDLTNYKGSSTDIWMVSDYTDNSQNTFIINLIKTYLPGVTVASEPCGYACSDHGSWHNAGFYASFPCEASDATDNPNMHTVNDTYAFMGNKADHALKFAKIALAFAVELGSDGPIVVPGDKTETFSGSLALNATKSFGPFKVGAGGAFMAKTTGTGDIDLYTRKTSVPTTSSYDCKSAGSTSTESCSINFSANGDAYVLLKGYAAGNYNLTVTYRPQ
ncbi:M20/M25/M40 family metallo-hydrolase [Massilia sp. W12]|uniref:M20/M25/M40 family metallo-hydrolase n=1 Tax=Massilia sp. W12 TaxID=3126507 RepID=UPI0030CB4374